MKYIGENAIKKLISLIKGDLATKQDSIAATGVLERDTTGVINGVETVGATLVETQEATLVDVPNGLLKGDGTTISAAVAGTDYVNSSQAIRYDAAQTLADEQKTQARGNIGAQNGTFVSEILNTKGWYRVVIGSDRSGGILTVQNSYNNLGPSSLKLLVTLSDYGGSLKCIEYTNYIASAITNVRITSNALSQHFIDVYYNVNGANLVAIDFVSTGLLEAKVQVPVYIGANDTLPSGENLIATMEYLNPPMQIGVEYRTTERYLGKPVYVKAINFGAVATGLNQVSFIPGEYRPIRCYAMLTDRNTTIPWIGTPGTDQSFCSINNGQARIYSTVAFPNGAVVFVGYYYKPNE